MSTSSATDKTEVVMLDKYFGFNYSFFENNALVDVEHKGGWFTGNNGFLGFAFVAKTLHRFLISKHWEMDNLISCNLKAS